MNHAEFVDASLRDSSKAKNGKPCDNELKQCLKRVLNILVSYSGSDSTMVGIALTEYDLDTLEYSYTTLFLRLLIERGCEYKPPTSIL